MLSDDDPGGSNPKPVDPVGSDPKPTGGLRSVPKPPVGAVGVGPAGVGVLTMDGLELDDGNLHVPELGSVVVVMAVPPKLQLVGAGFFW